MARKRSASSLDGDGTIHCILVAFDFGTTYTGISYVYTSSPEIQTVIIQFPDLDGSLEGETSDKVPTQLCYYKGEWKWGFEIPEDAPRYQWFKLDLSPEHKNEELTMLAIDHPDLKALPPSYNGEPGAVELSTKFLSKIREHTMKILRLQLGDTVIDTTPVHYTITVPAIWNDAAKAQTQNVASNAGMGDSIQIISEPEAAMMYVFHAMNPENLKVEDKVLLVDAGGGTVDLITYTVEGLGPIVQVREAVPGSGHACGSIFLNRIFRQWLAEYLHDLDGYGEDTLDEAMKEFEETTKRKFTGEEQTVKIGVTGMVDNADKGIKRQKLTIQASLLKSIFKPVMGMITTLVQAQLQQAKNAKAIVLVGGFGRSPYLRKCIQQVVGSGLDILQPPYGWTAVVRGALLRALHEASLQAPRVQISSRVARRAYGIKWNVKFNEDLHQGLPKKWDSYEGIDRVAEMAWLVKKGDILNQKKAIPLEVRRTQRVNEGFMKRPTTWIHSYSSPRDDEPPKSPNQEVTALVLLTSDLSAIAGTEIPVEKGRDGKRYYVLDFQIRLAFFSAHMEFSLWYKNKCYGKVNSKFN